MKKNSQNNIHLYWVLLFCSLIFGCASSVKTQSASLSTSETPVLQDFKLSEAAFIRLDTGYERTLASNSRWSYVGKLPNGNVYRPNQSVLTIEGRQVHEAYIVVNQAFQLMGFYLPGEQNFSPLTHVITLKIEEI